MRRSLHRLTRYTGGTADSLWLCVPGLFDLREHAANRLRMKVYLARYGRQNLLQWEDVETCEIDRYAHALSDLMAESPDDPIAAMTEEA